MSPGQKRIQEKEKRHAERQLAADANDLQPPILREPPPPKKSTKSKDAKESD